MLQGNTSSHINGTLNKKVLPTKLVTYLKTKKGQFSPPRKE